jgi:SET domain-containing protein
LAHYTFTWPADGDKVIPGAEEQTQSSESKEHVIAKVPREALALGLGSMFNHNRTPNIAWERQLATESIRYFTLREILTGEELCISYGPKVWFADADGPLDDSSEEVNDISFTGTDVFD